MIVARPAADGSVGLAVLQPARGAADSAVGIDVHNIKFRGGQFIQIWVKAFIDHLHQLVHIGHHIAQIGMIASAPYAFRRAGHRNEVNVFAGQSAENRLLAEPSQIIDRQVRSHLLCKNAGIFKDLCHFINLETLLDQRFQETLLGFNPAQISVGIAVFPFAEAHHTHSLLTVELLVAFLHMDGQILRRILIIHVAGHVIPYAADGVHQLAHGLPFHNHAVIRHKTHQLAHFFVQRLNTVITAAIKVVYGVDLLHIPVDVHHGVAGDTHDIHFLIFHIIGCQEHGICVAAAAGVAADHQKGKKVLFPVAGQLRAGQFTEFLFFCDRIRQFRPLEKGYCSRRCTQHGRGQRQNDQQNSPLFLFRRKRLFGSFRPFLAARRRRAGAGFFLAKCHIYLCPFRKCRASNVLSCTGLPSFSMRSTVRCKHNSNPLSRLSSVARRSVSTPGYFRLGSMQSAT